MAKRIVAIDMGVGTNPYNPVYVQIVNNGNTGISYTVINVRLWMVGSIIQPNR